jgi:hypothetical protein
MVSNAEYFFVVAAAEFPVAPSGRRVESDWINQLFG